MQTRKLSDVMSVISDSINKLFSNDLWIECEIASVSKHAKSGHWYLELVELDSNGNELCKVKASIWKAKADALITKFKNFTGSELSSGMKILINATPSFHVQYHLSLVINDIKPEFTLGGIEAKINMIVKELKERNEYQNNKNLKTPNEFTNCAVIAPSGAAGLGDFQKEADILAKYNICNFDYYETMFQGKEVSEGISQKIKDIFFSNHNYDCIIIIRGGGAKTDLHFLNDIKIARYICRCPIPVFVGIGHERDTGVLDLIANKSFDTPSKVIEYVYSVVVKNANDMSKSISLIEERSSQRIENFKSSINLIFEKISSDVKLSVQHHMSRVDKIHNVIKEGANNKILKIQNSAQSNLSVIEQSSYHLIDKTKTKINSLSNDILNSAIKRVEDEKKTTLSNFGLINAYKPSYILDLGFAMLRRNGKIISDTRKLKDGDEIQIESKDTIINTIIQSKQVKERENDR